MTEDSLRRTYTNALSAREEFERHIPVIRALGNRPPEGTTPLALPHEELEVLLSRVRVSGRPEEFFAGGKRYVVERDGGIIDAPLPTPDQKLEELNEMLKNHPNAGSIDGLQLAPGTEVTLDILP